MSKQTIWAWRQAIRNSDLAPLAKLCCYVLADYMRDAEKGCFPSVITLMKDTGLSNTSIARHIRAAIDAGLLARQRFHDRAGHVAGTNYFPRFPGGADPEGTHEEPQPETLGAGTFFDVSDSAELATVAMMPAAETARAAGRPSPWSRVPLPDRLHESPVPNEVEADPALTPLTHKSPLEGSKRKLQQPDKSEVQVGGAKEPTSSAPEDPNWLVRRTQPASDQTEIAFLAWVETAKRLAIPAYASRFTMGRRLLLQRTLAQAGGLDAWRAILERLARARFLLGQGKRGFWISFEALCSENIRVRLLEGAYDHVPSPSEAAKPATTAQVPAARWRERLRIWREAGALPETWPASWGSPPGLPGCLAPNLALD
jgi:hypothetical protein